MTTDDQPPRPASERNPFIRCLSAVLQERQPRLFGLNELVEAAVLVPLVQDDGGRWHLLFEVRSPDLRSRPSEICFPGGHVEPTDHTPAEAAVRETCEELQLPADAVQVLGALDILIASRGPVIHPYVGLLHLPDRLCPLRSEVAEVFTVAVERLLQSEPQRYPVVVSVTPPPDFPYDKIPGGRDRRWRTATYDELLYELDGRVIWGLTARILQRFLALVADLPTI